MAEYKLLIHILMNKVMRGVIVYFSLACLVVADWREDFIKRVPIYLMDTAGLSNNERADIIHDMYAGLIQEDASSLYFAFVFDKETPGGSWSEISFDSADIQELNYVQVEARVQGRILLPRTYLTPS